MPLTSASHLPFNGDLVIPENARITPARGPTTDNYGRPATGSILQVRCLKRRRVRKTPAFVPEWCSSPFCTRTPVKWRDEASRSHLESCHTSRSPLQMPPQRHPSSIDAPPYPVCLYNIMPTTDEREAVSSYCMDRSQQPVRWKPLECHTLCATLATI